MVFTLPGLRTAQVCLKSTQSLRLKIGIVLCMAAHVSHFIFASVSSSPSFLQRTMPAHDLCLKFEVTPLRAVISRVFSNSELKPLPMTREFSKEDDCFLIQNPIYIVKI